MSLTAEQRTQLAQQLVKTMQQQPAAPAPAAQGRGIPMGLPATELPSPARINQINDAYSAPAPEVVLDGVRLSDYGKLGVAGGADTVASLAWVADKMSGGNFEWTGDLQGFANKIKDDWVNSTTPAMREALSKQFVQENPDGSWSAGDGLTDINSILGSIVMSAPGMIGGMGAASLMAKGSRAAAALAGGGRGIQAVAARGGAVVGGGATEGAISAGGVGQQVEEMVMTAPLAELAQNSETFRQIYNETKDIKKAREETARLASSKAALGAGAVTAILGAPFNDLIGRIYSGMSGGRAVNALKGALTEAPTEAMQSGGENLAQQIAGANELGHDISGASLANDMVAGMAAGGVMGGGLAAFEPGAGLKAAAGQGAGLRAATPSSEPAAPADMPAAAPADMPAEMPDIDPMQTVANMVGNAESPSVATPADSGYYSVDESTGEIAGIDRAKLWGHLQGLSVADQNRLYRQAQERRQQNPVLSVEDAYTLSGLETIFLRQRAAEDPKGAGKYLLDLVSPEGSSAEKLRASLNLGNKQVKRDIVAAAELVAAGTKLADVPDSQKAAYQAIATAFKDGLPKPSENAPVVAGGAAPAVASPGGIRVPAGAGIRVPDNGGNDKAAALLPKLEQLDEQLALRIEQAATDEEKQPLIERRNKVAAHLQTLRATMGNSASADVDPMQSVVTAAAGAEAAVNAATANNAPDIDPMQTVASAAAGAAEAIKADAARAAAQAEQARTDTNTAPTPAQKEAGNYKKGRVRWQGLAISIESPKGSTRKGTDEDGNEWASTMQADYGYLKGTKGADGDQVDIFFGDTLESDQVFIVNQNNQSGEFDEHKVMLGFANAAAAEAAYRGSYSENWAGFGSMERLTVDEFKAWLKDGDQSSPYAPLAAPTDQQVVMPADSDESANTEAQQVRSKELAKPLTARQISDKAFVIEGDTKPHKDALKSAGGRWHKGHSAWMFPLSRKDKVFTDVGELVDGDIQPLATESAKPVAETKPNPDDLKPMADWRGDLMKARDYANKLRKAGKIDGDKVRAAWGDADQLTSIIDAALEPEPSKPKRAKAADPFADNKLFTADKVAEARARIKAKLSQMNSGIDPELLTDGMMLAGAYIEAGVRKFGDYAEAMTADLGDKIRPYLLSFWEGARNYPGLDTEGMTGTQESADLHKKLMEPGIPASEAKAVGETSKRKRPSKDKRTGAQRQLQQDFGVTHIDGYADSGDREAGNDVKDAFLKDARLYLKAVSDLLVERGFKAAAKKAISVNAGGVAVSGDVSLVLTASNGMNAYVNISGSSLAGTVPATKSGISILWRVSDKTGDTYGAAGVNTWALPDFSAGQLADAIAAAVEGTPRPTTKPKESPAAPEHKNNEGKPLDRENVYSGPDLPARETAENKADVPAYISTDDFHEITNEFSELLAPPAAGERVVTAKRPEAQEYISKQEAEQKVAEWMAHAAAQNKGKNSDKIVISLFDKSGVWSQPWVDAGYNVLRLDIQDGHDVMDLSAEYFNENFDLPGEVYAILAACPCTDFASSGARWFNDKDADGRTEASKELVFQTLRTIEFFRPKVWALENPVGRIASLTGLPEPRMSFDPHHFGEDYTKKTMLWGRFDAELPLANTEPTAGSKMHQKYGGRSQATKDARSVTPVGFAYAFFMANNYEDLSPRRRLEYDYPEISGAVKSAFDAGMTESDIRLAVDDHYGDYEYDAARTALAEALPERPEKSGSRERKPPRLKKNHFEQELMDDDGLAVEEKEPTGNEPTDDATNDRTVAAGQSGAQRNAESGAGRGADSSGRTGGNGAERSDETAGGESGGSGKRSRANNSTAPSTALSDGFYLDSVPDVAAGTESERVAGNLAAIRTLRKLQQESRPATPEEKQTLARYVGWGGLAFVFDPKTPRKYAQKAAAELKSLVSESEFNLMAGSTTTAFYTSGEVVKAMWAGAEVFGIGAGGRFNALEPAVGTGNFIGWQPQHLRDKTRWFAAELDSITGEIASYLYDSSDVTIQVRGFEKTRYKDGTFTLAIGNPPYGNLSITDKRNPDISGMNLHNYMIARSAQHLHADGLLMQVVTANFLDTFNKNHRQLSGLVDFVGAVRLPNTAFKGNAGTEVVTDIVVFRRLKDGETAQNTVWTDTNGQVNGVRLNKYFEQHPENILGRVANDGSIYAGKENEMTVHPTPEHADLGASIRAAFTRMASAPLVDHNLAAETAASDVTLSESDLPVGGMMLDAEGKILLRDDDDAAGNAVLVQVGPDTVWSDGGSMLQTLADSQNDKAALQALYDEQLTNAAGKLKSEFSAKVYAELERYLKGKSRQTTFAGALSDALDRARLGKRYSKLRDMLAIRNTALELIRAERRDSSDIETLRRKLNKQYDAFAKEYKTGSGSKQKPGSLAGNLAILRGDLGIESGLDSQKKDGTVTKHDIFTRRMIEPYVAPEKASNIDDAVTFAIQEHGIVTPVTVAGYLNISPAEALKKLTEGKSPYLLNDPESGELVYVDDYLSGNVKAKYRAAQAAGLEVNADLLKQVLPADRPADKVKPSIRAPWIDAGVYESFLKVLGVQASIKVNRTISAVDVYVSATEQTELGAQFKNDHRTIAEIFTAAFEGRSIKVMIKVADGYVKNEPATKQVNAMINRMTSLFRTWVESTPEVRDRVARNFNDRVNVYADRRFNGSRYLKPVGINPAIELRRTQLDGAQRGVQSRNSLLDHVVGAGKTYTAIVAIMQRRRLGLSKKPLVAVPNHIIGAFTADFYKLFPGANILTVTEKAMSARNRRQFFSRIATGDYDAIIIGHSHLPRLMNSVEAEELVINEKLAEMRSALHEAREQKRNDGGRGATVKQIEESIKRLNNRLEEKREGAAKAKDEIGFTFDDLGVDHLVVDEAHEFKNLTYSTRSDRVVGMNDPKGSNKAFDLLVKVRALQAKENGGVMFMTGTPISNSLVELYTVMYYLAYDELSSAGLSHFDAFAGSFLQTETALEYTATGTVKERMVLKGVSNSEQVRRIYTQFADVISMDDLKRIHAETVIEKNARTGSMERTDFPVPKVFGGGRQLDLAPASVSQKKYNDYLIARMDGIESIRGREERMEYASIDNPLWVLSDARKASLDIRLVDPTAARDPNGKVARTAQRVNKIYNRWDYARGTQLVFSDMGTPLKTAVSQVRKKLVGFADSVLGKGKGRPFVTQRIDAEESYSQILAEVAHRLEAGINAGTLDAELEEKLSESLTELQALAVTADANFSVYDDLRAALVELRIPENEVAFIHEYDTAVKKKELFDMVNAGQIRVLVGSSAKMGAGTNVQKRLVALHHMDAPFRPSDMEQREGRIIRQENELYEADPDGFEVEIWAYGTEGSSDPVMWQILERKAKSIQNFRSGGMEDYVEDSDDADSYAQFKASSTGNPVYRIKLQSDGDLLAVDTELTALISSVRGAQETLNSFSTRMAANKKIEAAITGNSIAALGSDIGSIAATMQAAADSYQAASAEYDAALAAFSTLSPEEKKARKGEKPKKPARPVEMDLLGVDHPYSQKLKAQLFEPADKHMIAGGGDAEFSVTFGPFVFNVDLTRRITGDKDKEDLTYRIDLDVLLDGVSISVASSTGKSLSGSMTVKSTLSPRWIERAMDSELSKARTGMQKLIAAKDAAEAIAKIDTQEKQREYQQIRAMNDWLDVEVSVADTVEEIRRASEHNVYIAADSRRKVNETRFSTGSLRPVIIKGKRNDYQTIGPVFPNRSFESSHIAPALNVETGEYVHLLIELSPVEPGQPDPEPKLVEVRTMPEGAPAPSYAPIVEHIAAENEASAPEVPAKIRRRSSSAGLTREQANKVIYDFLQDHPGVSESDFIIAPKQADTFRQAYGIDLEPGLLFGGTYDDRNKLGRGRGKIWINLDAHTTPEALRETIRHETLVHYGLGVYDPQSVNRLLDAIAKSAEVDNGALRALWDDISATYAGMNTRAPDQASKRMIAEEVLARVAEVPRGRISRALTRLYVAVRDFLRRRRDIPAGMEVSDLRLIVDDISLKLQQHKMPRIRDVRELLDGTLGDVNVPARMTLNDNQRVQAVGEIIKRARKSLSNPKALAKEAAEQAGDLSADTRKHWLGSLTRRHLADYAGKELPYVKQYVNTAQTMDAFRNDLLSEAGELADKWTEWQRKNRKEAEQLSRIMHRSTIEGVDPSEDFKPIIGPVEAAQKIDELQRKAKELGRRGKLKGEKSQAAIFKEIEEIKMALNRDKRRESVHMRLRSEYLRMSPAARNYFTEVRDFYKQRQNMMLQELEGLVVRTVMRGSEAAELTAKLRAEFEAAEVEGPYFPLGRHGEYFGYAEKITESVAMNQNAAYGEIRRLKEQGYDAISYENNDGDIVVKATLREFRLFESQREQRKWLKEQQADGFTVRSGRQLNDLRDIDGVNPEFLAGVEAMLDDLGDHPAVQSVRDGVYQMYLQTLPQLSMRKNFIHRKKTAGYSEDAARTFAKSAFHGSYQLARLRYSDTLQAILRQYKHAIKDSDRDEFEAVYDRTTQAISLATAGAKKVDEAFKAWAKTVKAAADLTPEQAERGEMLRLARRLSGDRTLLQRTAEEFQQRKMNADLMAGADHNKAADVYDEMLKRHEWAMNPKGGALANWMSSLGFAWYLGVSPAAAMVNMTQTPLVAMPLIASKYGWKATGKHLMAAFKEFIGGGINKPGSGKQVVNGMASVLTGDELKALQAGFSSGVLDKTLAHDLASVGEEGSDYNYTLQRVNRVVGWAFHNAERANREVTYMTIYRLAREKGKSHTEAIAEAHDLTWESHFDYSSGNKARFMQGDIAKVVLMFRQFSLNMTYLLARNVWLATKGESAEVKHLARQRLGGILGMHALFAGAVGLPMYSVITGILNLLLDDEDEPFDADVAFRNQLVDWFGPVGNIIARGPVNFITGGDVSGRVGLDGLWFRGSGYDEEGREAAESLAVSILGPIFGIVKSGYEGMQLLREGETHKAAEKFVPKFIRDPLRAYRYSDEGATNGRGDLVMGDFSPWEILLQANGLSPAELVAQYERNRALKNMENRIKSRRQMLINRYYMAWRLGDDDGMDEFNAQIERFNEFNSSYPITDETLERSIKTRGRYSDRSMDGTILDKNLEGLRERVIF